MERFTIAAKNITPFIDLNPDSRTFLFQGESYPENVLAFYRPVLDWMRNYFQTLTSGETTQVQVALRYMNTSSTKIFMNIFDLLQNAHNEGKPVNITWFYHRDDDLIREMGEDLSTGLSVPFRFLPEQ